MKIRSIVASSGLLITKDSIDVQHVRLAPGVPARIRRFALFIREALKANPSQVGVAAARLVALDAIRPSSLGGIQADWAHLYCWRGFTHLEWQEEDPPRLERRALSRSTLLALHHRSGSEDLAPDLKKYLAESPSYAGVKPKDRLAECERDALCWWYQCLPMPLFFHVSGLQPLSAVSRLCLAREQTQTIPVLSKDVLSVTPLAVHETCAEMLDFAALSEGSDQNAVVLQQATDRLKSAAAEPDAAALRRWVVELMELRFSALRAGPITSLLIAWAIDLCESGTIRSESPSKETPQKYFNKAAEPLLRKLRSFPDAIAEWQIDLLDAAYQELIAEEMTVNPGGASARTLASALSNFHAFLMEWFDVPPLKERLHDAVPLIPVRANVVWDHVFNLAYSWINGCSQDRRLQTALKIIFSIAKEAPARATELMFLRVRNVVQHPGYIEIEVAPSLKYGRLKTRAAQRRLRISDPYSMALILSWVKERRAAGAGDDSLLFADPVDSTQVYRRHTLSTLITTLLRAASGDPKTVGHDLRHSAISDLNEPLLASSSISDISRHADNATMAGHVTSMTSLVHYTHVYEVALRQRLDAALVMLVEVTSTEAAALL
ncbi:MAG: site-specific integrase, partial [Paludibacterium sp.]|uniref:site-specific integrase n=1 Tax=Paludibacterium sp. TaxID=1917523 RepID=UPI0025CF267D